MKLNIITSYPKSGNTWMRYIVYELFFNPKNYENDNSLNIKKFIPDLHQIQMKDNKLFLDEDLKNKKVFIKSHYSFDQMKNFPMNKIILVVRNPLDVFVSLYNYYDLNDKNKDKYVEEFAKNHTLPGLSKFNYPSWSEHLIKWLDSKLDICLIKYNSLIDDFDNEISKLLNFFNIGLDQEKLKLLKMNTSFSKLKSIEKKEKETKPEGFFKDEPIAKFKDRYFMNIGKKDSYKNFLSEAQISKLKESFDKYIKKYNL